MKQDSDGFYKSESGIKPLDGFALRNAQSGKLTSSVLHSTPINASKNRVLVFVKNNPKSRQDECAKHLGLAAVNEYYADLTGIGYITKSNHRFIKDAQYTITPAGVEASTRLTINSKDRHEAIASMVGQYEPYVPPKNVCARRGAEDASKIKSIGVTK